MRNDATTWVPVLNFALGVIGCSWLVARTVTRRREYPVEVLLNLSLAVALFLGLLVVSGAMILLRDTLQRQEAEERAFVIVAGAVSFVKVYALGVLWLNRNTKYRTGTRSPEGNPGADQNRDVDAPRLPRLRKPERGPGLPGPPS